MKLLFYGKQTRGECCDGYIFSASRGKTGKDYRISVVSLVVQASLS